MIIVNFRSNPRRRQVNPQDETYLTPGMVNWRITMRPHFWRPSTDVLETETRFIVRVEIAGMNEEDFSISVDQEVLSIHGIRQEKMEERRAYHQMEISFGEFLTQVELPANIDHEKIEAEYQDGFLRVILPKAQPKQIRINPE